MRGLCVYHLLELKISPAVLITQQRNDPVEPYGLSILMLATPAVYDAHVRDRYISLTRHLQILETVTATMADNKARWGFQDTTSGQQMAMTVSEEGQGDIMNVDLLAAGRSLSLLAPELSFLKYSFVHLAPEFCIAYCSLAGNRKRGGD